jgi:hypothetical protein
MGCLTRPVASTKPVTKTNFTTGIQNEAVDKVDLLFDIDNSASMGDKQQYLVQVIPQLVDRLLNPNCVDASGATTMRSANGVCPGDQTPEFRPVHDMHLGVVTSSLGSRLSDVGSSIDPRTGKPAGLLCDPTVVGNDDQGHLIARGEPPEQAMGAAVTPAPDAVIAGYTPSPGGFLYWYPGTNPAPSPPAGLSPVTDADTLVADFGKMVNGAGAAGCGIESQLESWYRFLVQPDPYASLQVDSGGGAAWSGVDAMTLRQRHDFLRPDSLVAVIVLSDENDSEIDLRSAGGTGYRLMSSVYQPGRGTSACSADPASPDCVPCASKPSDPACTPSAVYTSDNDWGKDPNLRHVHMKAKYGIDAQYPVQRYAIGLSSSTVPNRDGEYPTGAGSYVGNQNCTNPLFAASLPDGSDTSADTICHLPVGTRTTDLIYYAVIGGVPHELLHFVDGDPSSSTLHDDDWVRIVGRGPAAITMDASPSYDYTNIDPHMIEDYRDRTTVNYPFQVDTTMTGPLVPSASPTGTNLNGREWVTDQQDSDAGPTTGGHQQPVDRQFACTFPLPMPRDCSLAANAEACDCPAKVGGLSHAQVPSVCDDANPTMQTYAKAYPTIRELLVARLLGAHGIVSSLCPIHPSDQGTPDMPDPLYGYRPAVTAIVDRLKIGLNSTCIPHHLVPDIDGGTGLVPCLVLVTMPASNGGSCARPACDATRGLAVPPDDILGNFCPSVADSGHHSVCELQQLTPELNPGDFANGSCADDGNEPGWCYVTGVGDCAQSVLFSRDALPSGSLTTLRCIEQGSSIENAQLSASPADGG